MVANVLSHPLLGGCPETNHKLSRQGQAACAANADLSPGDDCCALCAADCTLTCPTCKRVHYCGEEHATRDKQQHQVVCGLLAAMAASEEIDVSYEQEQELLANFELTPQVVRSAMGWEDVLPAQYGTRSTSPEDINNGPRPSKRARVVSSETPPGSSAPTENTAEAALDTAPSTISIEEVEEIEEQAGATPLKPDIIAIDDEEEEEEGEGEGKGDEKEAPGAELVAAVEVATATRYLSAPATLVDALTGGSGAAARPLADVAAAVAAEGGALVVAVIGAAEDAELEHMDVWKALEGVVPGGIILQMVGPEVAASRHLQTQDISPSVRAVFYKGEYGSLVDHVSAVGPLSRLPALSEALATSAPEGDEVEVEEDEEEAVAPAATGEAGSGSAGKASGGSHQHILRHAFALPAELRALPHALVGFNLGLTCPDYSWGSTIKAIHRMFRVRCDAAKASEGTGPVVVRLPWLHTSNTQVEAVMEEEVVLQAQWSCVVPTHRNPWCSLEPLQSGTLANDVYRKSAWTATYQLTATVPRATTTPSTPATKTTPAATTTGGAAATPAVQGTPGTGAGSHGRGLFGWARALGSRMTSVVKGGLLGKRRHEQSP